MTSQPLHKMGIAAMLVAINVGGVGAMASPATPDSTTQLAASPSTAVLGFPAAWASLRGQAPELPSGAWRHVDWSTLPGMEVAKTELIPGVIDSVGACRVGAPEVGSPEWPQTLLTREIAVNPTNCTTIWQVSVPFVDVNTVAAAGTTESQLSAFATTASGTNRAQAYYEEYVTDPVNIVVNAVVANITYDYTTTSVTYVSGYCSTYLFGLSGWIRSFLSCTRSSASTSTSRGGIYVNANASFYNSSFCQTGTTYVDYHNVRIAGNPTGSYTASHSAAPSIYGGCDFMLFRIYEYGWGNKTL